MRHLPGAIVVSVLVLILQALTFSTLLGRDIISRTLQLLFYGPFLVAEGALRFARDSWDMPIPTTTFGGLPTWLTGLLLLMNWLVCSLCYFAIVRLTTRDGDRG